MDVREAPQAAGKRAGIPLDGDKNEGLRWLAGRVAWEGTLDRLRDADAFKRAVEGLEIEAERLPAETVAA